MRIILARHGETDYNKNKKVQGHSDIPLNEEGIRQGKEAGKKLEGHEIDVAYVSLFLFFYTHYYKIHIEKNKVEYF